MSRQTSDKIHARQHKAAQLDKEAREFRDHHREMSTETQSTQPAAESQWRPLGPGEIIQEGDEIVYIICSTGEKSWRKCPHCIGTKVAQWEYDTFRTRRPLPSAQPAAGPLGYAWREFDWPEDSEDKDNGQYLNRCITCDRQFIGHKRRNVCKSCANPVSLNDLEAQGDDELK